MAQNQRRTQKAEAKLGTGLRAAQINYTTQSISITSLHMILQQEQTHCLMYIKAPIHLQNPKHDSDGWYGFHTHRDTFPVA